MAGIALSTADRIEEPEPALEEPTHAPAEGETARVRIDPRITAEIDRRRQHFELMEWDQAALDRLAEEMTPGEYVGTIGAEACSLHNPFKESPRWVSRFPLPEPPPEVPEPARTRHVCFELRRCSECGHLHKIVLGEPPP